MMLFDDEPCECRQLSPGLYSVARGCSRHDSDGLGATHFGCVCMHNKPPAIEKLPCLACDENQRRGLAASGLDRSKAA